MSTQTSFVSEVLAFLTEPHTGQFSSSNPHLHAFAVHMRVLHSKGIDETKIKAVDTDENLSLSPDETDRSRFPDWRFNPSLVAPLVGAVLNVHRALTRIECLHMVGVLLRKAALVEKDAVSQKYQRLCICDSIRALKSYAQLQAPIVDAICAVARVNPCVERVSIESFGFVGERDALSSCNATLLAEFIATNQLNLTHGVHALPFEIHFAEGVCNTVRGGPVISTSNPYLALVFAICRSVMELIMKGEAAEDAKNQLAFAAQLAGQLSPSETLPYALVPQLVIKHTEMMLLIYLRELPLSSILEQPDLVIEQTNPLFGLATAEALRARFESIETPGKVQEKKTVAAECKGMIKHLLPCDAHVGRLVREQLLASRLDGVEPAAVVTPDIDTVHRALEQFDLI